MGVRSRSKRRRGASAGGADLISGLGDDVLVRILELLPDARDAVRTGALSRRWRGLWMRVGSLSFASSSSRREVKASSNKRFLAFVNKALAQRGKTDAALEHLAISFAITSPYDGHATKRLVLRFAGAAQEWVRYAVHSTVKSLVLELQLVPYNRRDEIRRGQRQQHKPTVYLSELASSAKLETMHWKLKGARLQLPTAAVFASLIDLTLENIEFVAGSDHLLSRFLSSACCPSLQKLQLTKFGLPGLKELLIEASTLLELSMSTGPTIEGFWTLKLKTPRLRYFRMQDDYTNLFERLEISAPRLEELFWPHQPEHIDVDGELPCVRSLKVELDSHGYEEDDDDINNGSICLLRCCTSLTCLEVSLHANMEEYGLIDIVSGRIPHLPHLISLTVRAYYLSNLHSFGVGLVEILKQCSSLKYLRVHYILPARRGGNLCNHPNHWKLQEVYLANLQEVDFTGLVGTDCEQWFIQGVLAHATQLQKVSLNFHPSCKLPNMIGSSTFISCNGGTWVSRDPLSYEWNCS